jgi:D-3-phosphoglycerate dehydrogenase
VSQPTFVVADGPFIDMSLVEPHCAAARVTLRRALLEAPGAVARATDGADGVLLVTNPLGRELIEALAPSVRVIGRAGVGLDAIDLEAAADRGVAVFHTPDYCVDEVATHALALALALNRRVVQGDAIVREDWMAWRALTPVLPLGELVVGVVGLGKIGRAVAARFGALVGEIVGFDPLLDGNVPGVTRVGSLAELLERADVVTLHVPLTPETADLIDDDALTRMRPGAILVNVSRGGLIDEAALARALHDGRLAGAALDVLATEPPPADHPLLHAPSVVLSPHFAWYSTSSERRVWSMTIDGMVALLAGEQPSTGRVAVSPPTPLISA